MKIVLIIIGIVIIMIIVGYLLLSRLVLVKAISGAGPAGDVEAQLLESRAETDLQIQLKLTGTESEQIITKISMERSVADIIKASAPQDFTEEPKKPEGQEVNDPEAMKYINDWNDKNIQWTGNYVLNPNEEQLLIIPAKFPNEGNGHIEFTYGHKRTFGGVIASFHVTLGEKENDYKQ